MKKGLDWPPGKEDLERLYLVEKLSAAKIARVYGLEYRNQKVAESTVLYQLRRNGIDRRGCTDHVRKVSEVMVDNWVSRYQAGESLKQIAGMDVSPVTVYLHLRRRGVQLRDKVEAQIAAVTKCERLPFSGDPIEKAYLMGLRYGDLHVVRHGRAIRIRVSSTHPAMADLFEGVFSKYGHASRQPRRARLVGFEWNLECDLDTSFGFLLFKPPISELELGDDETFLAFLAGFFDAEGSVLLHKKGKRYSPEVAISNSDREILDFLFTRLRRLGFSAHLFWRTQKRARGGIVGDSVTGRVIIWKLPEVHRFLRSVPIRHREKLAKAELVLALENGADCIEVARRWKNQRKLILEERMGFIQKAAVLLSEKRERINGAWSLNKRKASSFASN